MKTIGILGGLGPQATMDFERRLHRVAQQLIPPQANSGYPPLVVYYHRRPPIVVNSDHTPILPMQPDPALLEAARWLGTRADFLVITANAPHLVRADIERSAGRPVLSMIDVTLAEARRRGWHTVGVLGFGDPRVAVYTGPLAALGLAHETIDAELQAPLDDAVLRTMEGRDDASSTAAVRLAVDSLRARGTDGIILGCTELPLLLGPASEAADLLNPAQLLAEAAVRHALGEREPGA